MTTSAHLLYATIIVATGPLSAQQRPGDNQDALTEPDQELDGFSGKYAGIHIISARLRGVRGADSTRYRVSAAGGQLTAYKRGKQLWQADVAKTFSRTIPTARITKLILASNIIFVSTTRGGYAEVDRTTGKIGATSITPE